MKLGKGGPKGRKDVAFVSQDDNSRESQKRPTVGKSSGGGDQDLWWVGQISLGNENGAVVGAENEAVRANLAAKEDKLGQWGGGHRNGSGGSNGF